MLRFHLILCRFPNINPGSGDRSDGEQPMKSVQVTEDVKNSKEMAEPAPVNLVLVKERARTSEPVVGDLVKKIV